MINNKLRNLVELSTDKALMIHEKVICSKLAQNIGDLSINNKLVVLLRTEPMDLAILVASKETIVPLTIIIMADRLDKGQTRVKVQDKMD